MVHWLVLGIGFLLVGDEHCQALTGRLGSTLTIVPLFYREALLAASARLKI